MTDSTTKNTFTNLHTKKIIVCAQVMDADHPILGFFHQWIIAFADRFAEVHVICLEQGRCELPANVFVYSLGKEHGVSRLTYVWRFYKYFGRLFFRVRAQFVFFHMGAIFNVLAAPFFWLRRWYQVDFYWWKAHGRINRFGRLALCFVDRVYTSTETGFPIATPKRRVIGQAIDCAVFMSSRTEARTAVLYTGRIAPIKKLEQFAAVAAELGSMYASYEIVGPTTDANYESMLRALPTATNVTFVGPKPRSELVDYYARADIFLNPSVTNSMDKTVLEAIMSGCIPVTGNKAFAAMLSPYGLYAEHQTAADYAAIIRSIEGKDRQALRESLMKEVRADHSLETFTDRIFSYD